MGKQLKTLAIAITTLFSAGFILFIANQIYGLYQLTTAINPFFGQVTLYGLTTIMIGLTALPVILLLKLPKPLDPVNAGEDLDVFRKKVLKRLQSNKILRERGLVPNHTSQLADAIKVLDEEAEKEIKNIASTVFLTTAISQNGKLDALTVLITQSKMVWRVAHIYYQRPGIKDMMNLYANVGAATFLASEIEDLDISEQFQPVIRAMMKNTATKSIPIVGSTANIVMDSLLEGTTNAFLTLRVGIIAKKYCGAIDGYNKSKARKRAYVEASELLGKIVLQSSGKVISSIVKATKQAGVDTIKSGIEGIKNTGAKVGRGIANTAQKIIPSKKKEEKFLERGEEQ